MSNVKRIAQSSNPYQPFDLNVPGKQVKNQDCAHEAGNELVYDGKEKVLTIVIITADRNHQEKNG